MSCFLGTNNFRTRVIKEESPPDWAKKVETNQQRSLPACIRVWLLILKKQAILWTTLLIMLQYLLEISLTLSNLIVIIHQLIKLKALTSSLAIQHLQLQLIETSQQEATRGQKHLIWVTLLIWIHSWIKQWIMCLVLITDR